MSVIKFASRVREKSRTSGSHTCVYAGSLAEMEALYEENPPGSYHDNGKIESTRIYQESPKIWCCEIRCSTASDGSADNGRPETTYGKKSAQLTGTMLSVDLATCPAYRMCWNHYLVGAPGVDNVPGWWENTKESHLNGENSQNYAWIKSLSEMPQDEKGRWHVLKEPLKPGIQQRDIATYTITINARFNSAKKAGKMVGNTLNKIGTPEETFDISGGDWKCDNVNVFYDGSAWIATQSWTRRGDTQGWDRDIYKEKS